MELLLIRHLPTKWNELGILQGSQDIPILPLKNEDGDKIKENMRIINSFNPDIVLASQLQRTQQTALQYGFSSPLVEALLNELQFGKFEGVEKKAITSLNEWTSDPRSLVLGERLVDFERRIFRFLNKYNHYPRILVFGHGSWIRGLLSIQSVGTIQNMNQILVENNQLIHLLMNSMEFKLNC